MLLGVNVSTLCDVFCLLFDSIALFCDVALLFEVFTDALLTFTGSDFFSTSSVLTESIFSIFSTLSSELFVFSIFTGFAVVVMSAGSFLGVVTVGFASTVVVLLNGFD